MLELLEAYNRLTALEEGGVDNWGWYGPSIGEYVRSWMKEKRLNSDDYYSIHDIAKDEIKNYQKYEDEGVE